MVVDWFEFWLFLVLVFLVLIFGVFGLGGEVGWVLNLCLWIYGFMVLIFVALFMIVLLVCFVPMR